MTKKTGTYRKKTRELLMRLLYQCEATGDWSDEARDAFLAEAEEDAEPLLGAGERPDMPYFLHAFACVRERRADIDARIEAASVKWSLRRMNALDLAILRLATAELLAIEEIREEVSVNEAVQLAKKYGTEKSPSFVNGVLGQIIRTGAR